jgi:hypothetical protein
MIANDTQAWPHNGDTAREAAVRGGVCGRCVACASVMPGAARHYGGVALVALGWPSGVSRSARMV